MLCVFSGNKRVMKGKQVAVTAPIQKQKKQVVAVAEPKQNQKTAMNKKSKIMEVEPESDSEEEEEEFDSELDSEFDSEEEEFDSEEGSQDDNEEEEDEECDSFSELDDAEKIKMFSDEEAENLIGTEGSGDDNEEAEEEEEVEYDSDLYSSSDDEEEAGQKRQRQRASSSNNEVESHDEEEQEESDSDKPSPSNLSPTVLRERIQSTLAILQDWKTHAPTLQKSRSEVLTAWHADLAAYYSYSEYMIEKLAGLFSCAEAVQFFEANEQARPVTLRVNTLKTKRRDLIQALTSRGVTIESLGQWTPVGLQVFDSPVPIGATPEYMAGQYLLQAGSSLLPVQALAPSVNDRVLDMSAAPGGKSTHLAALMRNTGILFANDSSKDRLKSLIANIHRMGVSNSVVCNYDARKLPGILGLNSFHKILLDAPCSGTGVISKDPTVKAGKTDADFVLLTHLQKELILAAADMCEVGGNFVYSTCSVTVEENEEVVAYALLKRKNIRLVDTGIPFGKEGFTAFCGKQFPAALKLTRRFYPHMHNMDGFFVSKFEKF